MDFLEAVQFESLENIKYLLDRLQEITTVNLQYSFYIAVKTAVSCGREDVVQLLLEKNCSANLSTDTPLHIAAKLGNAKIVQVLLEKEASITVTNEAGDTPLHVAFENMQMEVVDLMLNSIAQSSNYLNSKNQKGLTHLHIACERANKVVVDGFLAAASNTIETIKGHSVYKDMQSTEDIKSKEFKQDHSEPSQQKTSPVANHSLRNELLQNTTESSMPSTNHSVYKDMHSSNDRQSEDVKQESIESCKLKSPVAKNSKSLKKDLSRGTSDSSDSDDEDISQKSRALFCKLRRFAYMFSDDCQDSLYNNETSEFHLVCGSDDPGAVKRYLRQGADVNAPLKDLDWNGFPEDSTPLHCAVEKRQKENVKVLMKYGADVTLLDENRATPLHVALYNDDPMDDGETLNLLYEATRVKSIWTRNLVEKNGMSFLHVAASRNDLESVRRYLDQGEDVNQRIGEDEYYGVSYFTPLHFAAQYRHQQMVELLIERGADVNSRSVDRPLHVACDSGHRGIIELLLSKGARADKNAGMFEDKTPLHLMLEHIADSDWAKIYFGDCKNEQKAFEKDFSRKLELFEYGSCFQKLLLAGCDINAQDKDGNTALHYSCATLYFHRVSVCKLLWLGADINLENNKGKTPMETRNFEWYNGEAHDFMVLYHHVQELKALGLEVNPKNEEYCKKLAEKRAEWSKHEDWTFNGQVLTDEVLADRNKKRLDEVEKMKKVMLTEKISLYDFVRFEPKSSDARELLISEKLREIMKQAHSAGEYGVYWYRIWLHWNKSVEILKAKKKRMLKKNESTGACKRARV